MLKVTAVAAFFTCVFGGSAYAAWSLLQSFGGSMPDAAGPWLGMLAIRAFYGGLFGVYAVLALCAAGVIFLAILSALCMIEPKTSLDAIGERTAAGYEKIVREWFPTVSVRFIQIDDRGYLKAFMVQSGKEAEFWAMSCSDRFLSKIRDAELAACIIVPVSERQTELEHPELYAEFTKYQEN